MFDRNERLVTSYHEAGHAVARVYFGDAIRAVSIANGGHGLTSAIRVTPDTARKLAYCNLAGPAAEYLVSGRVDRSGCTFDLDRAERHLRNAGIRFSQAWPRTLDLIEIYQDDLNEIAAALQQRGRLNRFQFEAVLEGKWYSPRWDK
jgi:hypothetical protein